MRGAQYVHYSDSTGHVFTREVIGDQLAAEARAFEMLEGMGGDFEWERREVTDGVLWITVGGQHAEHGTWTITIESH